MITEEAIRDALRHVFDPELGFDIVSLGLVYRIVIEQEGRLVEVDMTLTTPTCPIGPQIIAQAREQILALRATYPELEDVQVNLVWNPFWNPSMMSDEAREQLGFF